jgi:hypothetical protein
MFAAQAPSKYAKTGVLFGSTGSSHGIPPNLERIMTQDFTIRNEIYNGGEGKGLISALMLFGNQSVREVPAEGFEASALVSFDSHQPVGLFAGKRLRCVGG